ncbi:MAG TPA: AMP-dependent synthetase/ligase, partial [Aeromicrobium sp.]|nr:AMP-dependent synthetase/ligase [Aeromicrobium sp.]
MTNADLPALGASTLCEAFQLTVQHNADAIGLRTPENEQVMTFGEWAAKVERVAGGLAELGLQRGDTLALMTTNRPEFFIADMAALHLGATPFSIYNSSAPEQVEYLFGNAGNRIVIAERQYVETIKAANADLQIIVLEDGLPEADFPNFEASWRAVEPTDIATLIYTSGTTGPPKGVQLSHANLMASVHGWAGAGLLEPHGRSLSYLPLAHVADRFIHYYRAVAGACSITCVADATQILAALADTKPTGWMSVPRLWEKIKAGLESKGIADPSALMEETKAAIRAQLGLDQLVWGASGAAPIPPSVLEYFMALGIPVLEGWAMSETACCGILNPMDAPRPGSIGKPLAGVEMKVADDGELLVRGDWLMVGYRNDPEKTAEAINPEGWLHTGDVVSVDDDGYVTIIDRKKELIISAGGKNMSPANIEQKLKASHALIGQACCIGDARPYNVALLVLDPDASAAYAAAQGLDDSSPAALSANPEVRALIALAVEEANSHLSRVEQIKKFKILGEDWMPDSDILTPTSKLKRRGVNEKY